MGRPNKQMFVDNDLFCKLGNVYLINYGLNYVATDNRAWNDDIGNFLLNVIIPNCIYLQHIERQIFIWRETSAQHFRRIGGYYQDIYDSVRNENASKHAEIWQSNTEWEYELKLDFRFMHNYFECAEQTFYNKTFEINYWRNRMMNAMDANEYLNVSMVYPHRAIEGQPWNTLFFIPFKEVTDPLFWMHRLECTHYCHSPFLWEYIFDSTYRIIKHCKQFSK